MLAGIPTRGITLSLVLVAHTVGGCAKSAPPEAPKASAPSSLLGKPAPEFVRTALDGTKVEPAAMRGRVVVLEFFAQHCVPCRTAMPAAQAAQKKRPAALFVGVSEDDAASTAANVARSYGVTFPIVHDQGKALAGRHRVSELPATIVIDAAGVVRWVGAEASTTEELTRVIDSVATP
jgi:cytochrome c biogenesis protein CcmG/thiol:disulfide interchange protein DsbE